MRILLLTLLMATALSGCHQPSLTCHSEFLYPQYLASTQVNTPELKAGCFYGQQILVFWRLPKECFKKTTSLALHIRYGNREIQTVSTVIEKQSGWWHYRLVNQDYWCRGGILAYRAELLQEGQIIAEWRHFLWADIIDISPN
jgi:hypothetical protein